MEKIHQTITIPDDVFKFMLANEPTTVQPSNQEVLSHFKSIDCLVEAKAQSSSKEKKNSSRSNRKKLTVNNDETANKEPCTTKNEEDTINQPTKSVVFDKPGLKSFLLSNYKQMSRSKIYPHQAFKFSQDDLEKAMETIEKNPETQFCSQITKFELATYLLMKQHKFDKESAAWCDNNENFLRVDDTKQRATAQSKSSENSFEKQNGEVREFEWIWKKVNWVMKLKIVKPFSILAHIPDAVFKYIIDNSDFVE